jgi:hypothetical protein
MPGIGRVETRQIDRSTHSLLFAQRGDAGVFGLQCSRGRQRFRGVGVAGFAIQRERQIASHVFMAREYACGIRQPRKLVYESLIEQTGVAAVVAVAGAGIEQRIAAEQRRASPEQTGTREPVAWRVEYFELHRASDFDQVTARETSIYSADDARGAGMRQHFRAARGHDTGVAVGVIAMFVGVEDLPDAESASTRDRKALVGIQGIDDQRFAGFGAGDE